MVVRWGREGIRSGGFCLWICERKRRGRVKCVRGGFSVEVFFSFIILMRVRVFSLNFLGVVKV